MAADGAVDEEACQHLLQRYPRAVAHMRQQLTEDEFGLIFGAGASIPYGFPTWTQLLERIATNLGGDHSEVLQLPAALAAETLFQKFRSRNRPADAASLSYAEVATLDEAAWREFVHDCLYADSDLEVDDTKDLYGWFADVVERSQLTINYNFDDRLERVLEATRNSTDARRGGAASGTGRGRAYEVVPSPLMSRASRGKARIFHPNGYLPKNIHDGSTAITFSQTSFADQLLLSGTPEYAPLFTLLRMQTFLLVGLSLEDETLRHVLRQHTTVDPASVNYYVRFVGDERMPQSEQESVRSANFEVFGLVTLFLDSRELRALSDLLTMPSRTYKRLSGNVDQPIARVFYITGAVGVGKSSVTRSFRDLRTVDEWSKPRPRDLTRDASEVENLDELDKWIADQMLERDIELHENSGPGMTIVDRTPIDPLIFTPDGDFVGKAKLLRSSFGLDRGRRRLVSGHVIVLLGDPAELSVRVRARSKSMKTDTIERQERLLQQLFPADETQVHHINSRKLTLRDLVKKIAEIVHLGPNEIYDEVDFVQRLQDVADEKLVIE